MRSACSAEFFVHRLILQTPVGLDVDIATTLEENEGETLRKMVIATMRNTNGFRPCKTSKKSKHGETLGTTNEFKSKLECILESSESTRQRMEESLPKYREDHIAGKGDNSLQHYNLVHKFIPMPQSNEDTRSKSSSG